MTTKEMNEELEKGVLMLDAGEYELTGPLYVGSRSGIIGEEGVVFRVRGDFPAVVAAGEKMVLRSFTVKVLCTGYSNHVIFVKDSFDVVAEGISIEPSIPTRNAGICFYGSSKLFLREACVAHARFGIFLTTNVEEARVESCDLYDCITGIYVYGKEGPCSRLFLADNRIWGRRGLGGNGEDAVLLDTCREVYVNDNWCFRNREHGIYLSDVEGGEVCRNRCLENTVNGIQLVGAKEIVVDRNVCCFNEYHGIYLDRCKDVVLFKNFCAGNKKWGILRVESEAMAVENYVFGNGAGEVA